VSARAKSATVSLGVNGIWVKLPTVSPAGGDLNELSGETVTSEGSLLLFLCLWFANTLGKNAALSASPGYGRAGSRLPPLFPFR
jgi:hypothetical protein